jgi:serine/threonine protein kinase
MRVKKEQTRKQLEEVRGRKAGTAAQSLQHARGRSRKVYDCPARRQEPFKVSRRESRVKNMEPNSITDADTREKETMPDEHGIRQTSIPNFSSATTLDWPLCDQTRAGAWRVRSGLPGFGREGAFRLVVVKVLLDEKISHKWSVRKFKQEMEALARIDHPSVIGIFDSGQLADGRPYLVMQYVDGVSLRSVINVEGMDLFRAADIVRQIGKALSAAHDRGIFHRDLKPENIMLQQLLTVTSKSRSSISALAKVKDSVISMSTASDRSAGTAAYMSPEQLCAGSITRPATFMVLGLLPMRC